MYHCFSFAETSLETTLLGKDWATRAPVAQTLHTVRNACPWHRGTCAYLFARFVFSGTFVPTGYIPVHIELQQHITVPVGTLKNDKITSCLGSDGQHAPRTRKHCTPCAKHAHDTGVRAHTCLHGLFSGEHSYQPGTFQCTSSCNNRLRWRWIPQQQPKLRVA